MKKKYTLGLFLAIIISSCNNQATTNPIKVIDKNSEPSLKEYFSSIDLIPLETNEESFLLNISKTVLHNGKYYFFDRSQKGVFIFDEFGKFLKKIVNVGKGPSEYTLLTDFEIDVFNNRLILLSPLGKLLIHDLEGNFIKETVLQNVGAVHYLKMVSANVIILYAKYQEEKLIYYSLENKKIIKKDHKIPLYVSDKIGTYGSPFSTYTEKKQINFFEPFTNNVYILDGQNIKHNYSWDFGEFNFDFNVLPTKKLTSEETLAFEKKNRSNWAYRFMNNFENNKYIFTVLLFKGNWHTLVYNKDLKNSILFQNTSEKTLLSFSYMDDSKAITVINPSLLNKTVNSSLLSSKNVSILKNIQKNDNPIIVKYNFND